MRLRGDLHVAARSPAGGRRKAQAAVVSGEAIGFHAESTGLASQRDVKAGEANGDMIVDFAGNGAAAGDSLQFVGYGPGATFTNIDPTHWQVNYNGGSSHDIITFANAASIDATDFIFL